MLLPTRCPVCGRAGAAPCGACIDGMRRAPALPVPVALDRCHALLAYEGGGRDLVARLKYRNHRAVLGWLAPAMADLVADPVDAVTWAPTTGGRRRHRGFDQAELLARGVARHLGVGCVRLLRRRPGPAQTGRSAAERRAGPHFVARRSPARVVLVDDVITTGATVTAAATALRAAGVTTVIALAAARTPPRPYT